MAIAQGTERNNPMSDTLDAQSRIKLVIGNLFVENETLKDKIVELMAEIEKLKKPDESAR